MNAASSRRNNGDLSIDGFVALGFAAGATDVAAVNAIAAQCVTCFDTLRAPATAKAFARRRALRGDGDAAAALAERHPPNA